jgi:hypothetical protein
MLDVLFGIHIGGWKAMVQFWFWAVVMFSVLLFLYKKGK